MCVRICSGIRHIAECTSSHRWFLWSLKLTNRLQLMLGQIPSRPNSLTPGADLGGLHQLGSLLPWLLVVSRQWTLVTGGKEQHDQGIYFLGSLFYVACGQLPATHRTFFFPVPTTPLASLSSNVVTVSLLLLSLLLHYSPGPACTL